LSEAKPHSVHTQQTNGKFAPSANYRAFSDRFIRHKIKFVSDVYANLEPNSNSKKVWRLSDCRSKAFFMRHEDTGLLRIAAKHCNLRWCPLCSKTRRNFVAGQTRDWLRAVKRPKLLTVTLKHSNDSLEDQIDRIYKCFQIFRKRSILKKSIAGGIWFFQIKTSKSNGQWHPHIHALIDSPYIPHSDLKRHWLAITGDSSVVDIRPIKDRDSTSLHVARYAAAPCDLTTFPLEEAADIVKTLDGRRICGTWGTGRTVSLRPHRPEERISNF